jgi:hypothetical protein
VLDKPLKPTFGSLFRVQIKARLCQSPSPVSGAEVAVKLVSSLKKASGLLSGHTGPDGLFVGEVQLPPSQPGQCAVVVSCSSDQGFDEVKATVVAG